MRGKQASWTCYMTGKILTDPDQVFRVHSGKLPKDVENAASLAGKFVCGEQARLLRKANFVVFNWGRHLEKKREEAKVTIGNVLKAKASGKLPEIVAEAIA